MAEQAGVSNHPPRQYQQNQQQQQQQQQQHQQMVGRAPPPSAHPRGGAGAVAGSAGGSTRAPNPRAILVNPCQRGNPVLRHVRNVPTEFASIIPDYQMGKETCALFLSVRYHQVKPKYIYGRMEQVVRGYALRVLLCLVDCQNLEGSNSTVDPKLLADIHRAAIFNGWTLVVCWSPEEAARYLETYQSYEHKRADVIQEKVEGDYFSRVTDVLTTIRSVNKTDAANLSSAMPSLAAIMRASKDALAVCSGIGPKKVERIWDAFHEPFVPRAQAAKRARQAQIAEFSQPVAPGGGGGASNEGGGEGDGGGGGGGGDGEGGRGGGGAGIEVEVIDD